MNLSAPFIRRPVATLLVTASLFLFGLMAYRMMPVSDLPNVDLPTIQVTVGYPGASPETMANAIATPLEQQFMTIEGIQTVFSTSNTGSTTLVLQFVLERDIDSASTDVQAAISRAQPYLPSNLPNNPTYQKVNPAATPILYYAISSENMTLSDLYDYAHTFIGERLSMIEGVAQVITYGSPYAVRVQVDPEKLAAKNIGLDEVTASIQAANVDLPLGTLYGNRDDFTIDADGQLLRAPGYSELTIKNENGELVKIKEIGRALDSIQNDKFFQHYITHDPEIKDRLCMILAIQRLPGMNTVKISQAVETALQALKTQLPDTLEIFTIYDEASSIVEGVDDVKLTLFLSFLLVVAIVYLSLGKALNTVIPSATLPITVFGTFAAIFLLGFSIDILSLLALTLSIGFLIDDAIVVLENNVRHVQQGSAPQEAALNSSREISTTVLSMTLCLVAAFIPLLFMGGVVGKLFREFAVTIIVAVSLSGFVSLTLTPMLCSRFIRPYSTSGEKKSRVEKFSDAINERLKNLYEPCLRWALRHPLATLGIGAVSLAASLLLFFAVPKDFLPPDDIGFLDGYTQARDGTSPFLMEKYHEKINQIAIQDPNIESIISVSSYTNANEGVLFLKLKPFKQRQPMDRVIQELSDKLKHIPGINVFLSPLPLINLQVGTTAQGLYQYSLTSIDRKSLYDYAPKLVQKMKNHPSFTQVSSDLRDRQPQWDFHILRDRAANYNVSAAAIENFFQYAYSDNKISQINADINQYNVLIETLPQFYKDPTVLSKLYIRSTANALVPLSELVQARQIVGPLTVNHINGLSSVGISFNLPKNVPLGTALAALNQLTAETPTQIHGKVIGTADVFKSSFANLNFLLFLAFFVIYVILGILYENFLHPLTVMSALPPALFGGLLTLYLFNEPLSLYSFVGLILLIGIVLKNGIMMIDFALDAVEKRQKTPSDAIVDAALTRFRPILMTTAAALMGAVPIALGVGGAIAQSHRSLGLCIIGGLLVSQVLTLLFTPVIYQSFENIKVKLKRLNIKDE